MNTVDFGEYILKTQKVSLEHLDFIVSCFVRKSYKGGDFILKQGSRLSTVLFVETGCVIYYNYVNGKKNVYDIFFEGDWIAQFNKSQPLKTNIQVIQHGYLWEIQESKLNALCIEFPHIGQFKMQTTANYLAKTTQRMSDMASVDAKTRLNNLLKDQPLIFQRLPHYYIASFLGIYPETLSRLRKNHAAFIDVGQ